MLPLDYKTRQTIYVSFQATSIPVESDMTRHRDPAPCVTVRLKQHIIPYFLLVQSVNRRAITVIEKHIEARLDDKRHYGLTWGAESLADIEALLTKQKIADDESDGISSMDQDDDSSGSSSSEDHDAIGRDAGIRSETMIRILGPPSGTSPPQIPPPPPPPTKAPRQ